MTIDELLDELGQLMYRAGQVRGELSMSMRLAAGLKDLPDARVTVNVPPFMSPGSDNSERAIHPEERTKTGRKKAVRHGQRYYITDPQPAILDALETFDGPIHISILKDKIQDIYKRVYNADAPLEKSSLSRHLKLLVEAEKIKLIKFGVYQKLDKGDTSGNGVPQVIRAVGT